VASSSNSGSRRTVVENKNPRLAHRTNDVIHHVSKGWIPIHPSSLERVNTLLSTQSSDALSEQIITEVVKDPGLFLWTTRFLNEKKTQSNHNKSDPLTMIKAFPKEKLCEIFSNPQPSPRLQRPTPGQKLSSRTTTTAALAVRASSRRLGLDQDNLCSSAHFRSLGMSLISWNYPRIFSQCLSRAKISATEVEFEIEKMLGAGPKAVTEKLLQQWQVTDELRALIHHPQSVDALILEGAELFAKSREPKSFPTADALWKTKQDSYKEVLPSDLLEELDLELAVVTKQQSFDSPQQELPPAVPPMLTNPTLLKCDPYVRQILNRVYQLVTPGMLSPPALRALAGEAISLLGFSGGCLLIAKNEHRLIPSLRLGGTPLEYFKNLLTTEHGISLAGPFTSNLYHSQGIGVRGENTLRLSTGFINSKQPSVLYLECPLEQNVTIQEMSRRFHVIHHALAHALGEYL
jgi:hypothetical protein